MEFLDIRDDLITRVKNKLGDNWTDSAESDEMMALIEIIAYVVDMLNYNIDFQRKESALPTARLEKNVITLIAGLGYKPSMIVSATGTVTLTFSEALENDIVVPRGFLFSTSDIEGENITAFVNTETTIESGSTSATLPVTQGEILTLITNKTEIGDSGYIYIDTSYLVNNSIVFTYNGIEWLGVEDVYMDWRVGRLYSAHLSIDGGIEKHKIQLPYNYTTYITDDNDITIEYQESLGYAGNIVQNRLNALKGNLVDINGKDQTGLVSTISCTALTGGRNRESIDEMKTNAVNYIRSLESLISLEDYEEFARIFTGKICKAVDWSNSNDIHEPYRIQLYIDINETTRDALLAELNVRKGRPDIIEIMTPSKLQVDFDITVYVQGAYESLALITQNIEDNIQELFAGIGTGASLFLSKVYASVDAASDYIYRVEVTTPAANVTAGDFELLEVGTITVTFEEG